MRARSIRAFGANLDMDIIPNTGICNLRFGMSPAEVLALFPEKQKYEDWMGGNLNNSLLYHGLVLIFDKCNSVGPLPDSHMDEIWISGREDARLWGKHIEDWTRESVIGYLKEEAILYEISDGGAISVEPLSLTLAFGEEGQLEYIQLWAKIAGSGAIIKRAIRHAASFLRGRA
jgi:hypothetical protein